MYDCRRAGKVSRMLSYYTFNACIITYADLRRLCSIIFHTPPPGGSSYIPLPDELRRKTCIINPRNEDNRCLLYALTAAKLRAGAGARELRNVERRAVLDRHLSLFDDTGVNYPSTNQVCVCVLGRYTVRFLRLFKRAGIIITVF